MWQFSCLHILRSLAFAPWLCGAVLALGGQPQQAASSRDVIVVGVSAARAERIARHVTEIRGAIHSLLTGSALLHPWVPACTIHVHRDRASFARAVGNAPPSARGATTLEFNDDTVRLRRIDVMDAGDGGVPDALAHELVHVVLAEWFPDVPPPRWADEGLAVLFDSPAKQEGHAADFRAALSRGQCLTIADLMAMEHEPVEPARQQVFYGQSAALTRWLLDRRGGPSFLRLLREIAAHGPEAAVLQHEDIRSLTVADLSAPAATALPMTALARVGAPPGPAASDPGASP